MARTNKPKDSDRETHGATAADATARRWRAALHLCLVVVLAGGCLYAVRAMRGYVETNVDESTEPPAVVFKNRPAWMSDLLAGLLARSFRPAGPQGVFDRDALVKTTARLKASPWVAKVNQVRRVYGKGAGDTIEVDCEFRAPIALVRSASNPLDYWLVDAEGVKLPDKFAAADVPKVVSTPGGRTNIRIIEGVESPPPRDAGQKWAGNDLAAGLELVRRLYDQPFADDIVKVNVDNFGGRIDLREAQIVLVTKYNTEIRWGRPWSATDAFIEVRPERKMAVLRSMMAEFGRVDGKLAGIDIRFDVVRPTGPAGRPAGAVGRGAVSRGGAVRATSACTFGLRRDDPRRRAHRRRTTPPFTGRPLSDRSATRADDLAAPGVDEPTRGGAVAGGRAYPVVGQLPACRGTVRHLPPARRPSRRCGPPVPLAPARPTDRGGRDRNDLALSHAGGGPVGPAPRANPHGRRVRHRLARGLVPLAGGPAAPEVADVGRLGRGPVVGGWGAALVRGGGVPVAGRSAPPPTADSARPGGVRFC